jgi:prevent-host-death family protein
MSNVYTYSEARRRFSDVLNEAERTGEVRIKRRDGGEFVLRPVQREASPFEAAGPAVETRQPLSKDDIVDAVRAGRERGY